MTEVRDRSTPGPRTPSSVTMPLLDRIRDEALDEDYIAVAAQRRSAPGGAAGDNGAPAGTRMRAWPFVIVLVGALVAVAVSQTAQIATASESSRPVLIDRVEARRDRLADTARLVAKRRAEIREEGALQAELSTDLRDANGELARVRATTGFAPVSGPGVRIVVTDPEQAGENDLVRDSDLALLVNGLWSAGAEAITINGQRLTALSYIQNSGPVIRVNSQPLSPPYVVEAIGDPRTLLADLLDTPSGARFFDFSRLLGFGVTRQNVDTLSLTAARSRTLRVVRHGTEGDLPKPIQEGGQP